MKAGYFWTAGFIAAIGAGFLIWTGKGALVYRFTGFEEVDKSLGSREQIISQHDTGVSQRIEQNIDTPTTSLPLFRGRSNVIDKLDEKQEGNNKGNTADKAEKIERTDLVDKVVLPAPFQSQAPFGDWDQPWQDACEEASLVIANRFAQGVRTLAKEEMRDEILKLVEYQNSVYGEYHDSDAERTAEIGREVYGLRAEVREVEEINEVIGVLRHGDLVIAPMAGRLLKNPNFRPPGPLYHMIVIRGFDDDAREFTTHDVGTRRGDGYRYSYETIWDALHDFPGEKERILEGGKKVIVVRKQ